MDNPGSCPGPRPGSPHRYRGQGAWRRIRLPSVLAIPFFFAGGALASADPFAAVPIQDEGKPAPDAPLPSVRSVDCLNDLGPNGTQRKGVQKRAFLKRGRLAISIVGGLSASDILSSSYSAGAAVSYFVAESFGFEILGNYSPVRFRLEEPFTSFDRSRRFQPGDALQFMLGLLFSPFHAKFKVTEATIVHGDLFVVAGGGRTLHDSVQGLSWQAGFGLKLYLYNRLSLRFDVRDFVLPQEVLGRGRVTHNVTVLGGLSFWLG